MYQALVQFMYLWCVGRVSAIAFVCLYTTLTAMQSLHAQSNCVYMHVCECACVLLVFHYIFCFIPVCIIKCIIYSSHIPLAAPPFIVSCQTHSWWSLEYLCWRVFQEASTQHTLSCTTRLGETPSTLSLTDYQLMHSDISSLTSILMSMETPCPASAALHQVRVLTVVLLLLDTFMFTLVCLTLWEGVFVLPTTSLSCCGLLSDLSALCLQCLTFIHHLHTHLSEGHPWSRTHLCSSHAPYTNFMHTPLSTVP